MATLRVGGQVSFQDLVPSLGMPHPLATLGERVGHSVEYPLAGIPGRRPQSGADPSAATNQNTSGKRARHQTPEHGPHPHHLR
jgi:hypothetical protein